MKYKMQFFMIDIFFSVSSVTLVISLTFSMQSVTYFSFIVLTKTRKDKNDMAYGLPGTWGRVSVSGKVVVAFF